MKHSQLRSVAHSLADSLSCNISFITGSYDLDLYGDAARSPGSTLTVDLLNGKIVRGMPSQNLLAAIQLIPREFDRLCHAAGMSRDDCRIAQAQFHASPTQCGFRLTVEDRFGHATEADYAGVPAKRVVERDQTGRVRRTAARRLK